MGAEAEMRRFRFVATIRVPMRDTSRRVVPNRIACNTLTAAGIQPRKIERSPRRKRGGVSSVGTPSWATCINNTAPFNTHRSTSNFLRAAAHP